MLEQVREVLIANYNQKIEEFNSIKNELDALEEIIVNDNSEEEYKESLKGLKLKKLKKNSPEYKEELDKINSKYNHGLVEFKANYDKCIELRKKASMIDIYGFTRKITRVENAKSLEDLNIDDEKASKILTGELKDF